MFEGKKLYGRFKRKCVKQNYNLLPLYFPDGNVFILLVDILFLQANVCTLLFSSIWLHSVLFWTIFSELLSFSMSSEYALNSQKFCSSLYCSDFLHNRLF